MQNFFLYVSFKTINTNNWTKLLYCMSVCQNMDVCMKEKNAPKFRIY